MNKVPEELARERNFLKRKIRALANEYKIKVTYDFSRYIYVGVKENCNILLDDAINLITTCAGYEAHRVVNYKNVVANMYVRFADRNYANAAIDRLQHQEGYCIDSVAAILLSLYLEEMMKGNFPWTLAVVNIEGRADHTNPLSQDVLQGILTQFGDPRINAYQNGNQIEHVQVLFSSMSEALGASIAHGRWMRLNLEENARFYYNIRLMGSEKEATLLRGIQTEEKRASDKELEAFEMDYFVQKMETRRMPPGMEGISQLPDAVAPNESQDSRNVPRFREFRRQFSRGRGNGNSRRQQNTPNWQYENRNLGRFQSSSSYTLQLQEFINPQNRANLPA